MNAERFEPLYPAINPRHTVVFRAYREANNEQLKDEETSLLGSASVNGNGSRYGQDMMTLIKHFEEIVKCTAMESQARVDRTSTGNFPMHLRLNNTGDRSFRRTKASGPECFACGKVGHFARNCRSAFLRKARQDSGQKDCPLYNHAKVREDVDKPSGHHNRDYLGDITDDGHYDRNAAHPPTLPSGYPTSSPGGHQTTLTQQQRFRDVGKCVTKRPKIAPVCFKCGRVGHILRNCRFSALYNLRQEWQKKDRYDDNRSSFGNNSLQPTGCREQNDCGERLDCGNGIISSPKPNRLPKVGIMASQSAYKQSSRVDELLTVPTNHHLVKASNLEAGNQAGKRLEHALFKLLNEMLHLLAYERTSNEDKLHSNLRGEVRDVLKLTSPAECIIENTFSDIQLSQPQELERRVNDTSTEPVRCASPRQ